ncbi:MAG: tandem-95 repeat protein [Candidatus Stygibacter australis]|nr:tandem-95 repeat protein [Candidatus Stygibacter australis]
MKMLKIVVLSVIMILCVNVSAEIPDWEIIPGTQYSMQVYSQVEFMAQYFTNSNPDNIVAAFGPGGVTDCRAIAYWNEYNQFQLWYMTIVSNAEPDTELITYKVYDADSDQVLDCRESSMFADNTIIGSYNSAFLLTIPYVIDDFYGAYEDSLLTILPASGVLINDFISQVYIDEFEVVLDQDVSHGYLTLIDNGSFTYRPYPNYFGSDFFEYYATDGVYQTNIAVVEIQVQNVNDPPIINLPDSFIFPEDTVYGVDFTQYIYDSDNTELVLNFSGNVHVDVDIVGFYVTFTPELNFNGIENITFTINDSPVRLIDSDIVQIEVTPVNDPPYVENPIADFNFNEDTVDNHINLDFAFSDIEGDSLEYNVLDNINLNIVIDSLANVTISTFQENWNGSETVVFTAEDLEYTVYDTVFITVNPVNDAPEVILPLPDIELIEDFEDQITDLDDHFIDVDGDDLHFSANYDFNHVTIAIDENIMTISSVENWHGITDVTITAQDDYNRLIASDTFQITVLEENDPPILLVDLPDTYMNEDDDQIARNLNYYFVDYDNDPLDFSVDFESNDLNVWIDNDFLYFQPIADWYGTSTVTVTAADLFNDVSDSFDVIVTPVNDPPYVYLEIPDYILEEAFPAFDINLYDHFIDVDNDTLLFSASLNENNSIIVDIVGEIMTIASLPQWNGSVDVTVTAQDEFGRLTTNDTLTVQVNPVNDPPVLASPVDDQNVNEDFLPFDLDLSTHFSDPEDDPITYSVDFNDNQIGITVNDSILAISSVFNWYGTANVTVYASDNIPGNDPAVDQFDVIVQPVNDPPYVDVPIDDQYVDEDFEAIVIDLNQHFVDYDDSLSYDVEYDIDLINASIDQNTLTIYSRLNKSGDTEVSVTASDGNRVTVTDDFWVYIAPVNDEPVIALPETFEFYEDNILDVDFSQYVTDVDSDSLFLEATGNTNVLIDIVGLMVSFSNVENWNGQELVTFSISDEEFTNSDQVQVIVLPQADELTIILPQNFTFDEDESLPVNFAPYISNPDNFDIQLTYQNANYITVEINEFVVTFGAYPDWNGQEQITFEVSNINGPENSSDSVDVIVLPVNDPPTVTPIPDQYILEDSGTHSLDLDYYFDDVDGDILEYAASFENTAINVDIISNMLYFEPETNWNGTTSVTVTAQDGNDRVTVSDTFDVIVQPVNNPPEIVTYFNDVTKAEDFATFQIDFTGYFIDVDGDPLTYSVDFVSEEVNINLIGAVLELSAVSDWFGTTTIEVTASDEINRLSVSDQFDLVVTPVNDPPELIIPLEDLYLQEDFVAFDIDLDYHFNDVDQNLTYYVNYNEDDISASINQNFLNLNSLDNWYGTTTIEVIANDLQNRAVVTDTFDVFIDPVNDPPVVQVPLGDITIDEDTVSDPVNLDSNFFDIDGDPLVYSAQVSDPGGVIIIEDNIMTITAIENWFGSFDAYITADDQMGRATVTDTFHVLIMPVNDPPVIITPLEDLFFDEDFEPYQYDMAPNYADVDNSQLYFYADYISDHLTVTLNGSLMQINSVNDWTGDTEVVIHISDQVVRAAIADTFQVTVNPLNDPPYVAAPIPNQSKLEDFDTYSIDLDLYFDDIDGDVLSYEAVASDTIVTLDIQDNLLYFYSVPNLNGSVNITVTADDGINRLTAEDTFILTISAVNDPPMLLLPEEFTFDEDTILILDFIDMGYVFDVDTDLANLTLTSADGENVIVVINGTIVTFSADLNWFGTEVITFSLADESRRFVVTDTVNVVVNPVNDPPYFAFQIPDQQVQEGNLFNTIDLDYYVNDVDDEDETLTWQYSGNTDLLVDIDPVTHFAVVTAPDPDWNGDEDITFTVTDTYGENASDLVNFEIIPVNDAPVVLVPIPDQFVEINFSDFDIDLSPHFYDVDGDMLTYQVDFNDEQISVTELDGILTISSIINWNGVSEVIVTADDNVTRASVTDTFMVDVTYNITQTMSLMTNWNWISFYVQPEDYSLEYVFSDTLGENVNTVKYQTQTADYYPEIPGWFGDLEFIIDGGGYLVNVDDSVSVFSLTGNRIMSDTPIEMIADWNWIGYYPPTEDSLTSALNSILDNVHIVKNQTQSAEYFPEVGSGIWFGDLKIMAPGIGYKVQMTNPDILIYPLYPLITRDRNGHAQSMPDNSPAEWEILSGTSDNMILMLSAQYDNEIYEWADDRAMGIFDAEGICRAHGIWQESSYLEQGFWYFTIVGITTGDPLYIRLIDENNCESTCLDMISFQADTKIGTPFEPFQAAFYPVDEEDDQIVTANVLNQNYPNPFNPVTTISFELAAQDFVTINIFNLRGEKIKALVREPREAGSHSVIWDGTDDNGNQVASGIYFYSLNSSQFSATRKMVMIK